MGKLQGRDKLILAFMAAGVMLGTAWAGGIAYNSGDSKALKEDVATNDILSPYANGSNKLTLTGKEGTSESALSDKNFVIYGASGDVAGDSSLVLDWQAKLYTQGKVQFFAGGDGSNVTGNSSLTVNAADGSILYAYGGAPGAQQSIILAGSPNGGTVTGNTKLTINGALGNACYLKASGAAMIDKAGALTVNGDSTVEINASCEVGDGIGANGGLHIVANGLNDDDTARGILKGKATLIIDNPNARVEQIWGGNNSVANSGHTYAATESVAVYLRQGKVGAVTAGPSSWASRGKTAEAVVSKDVYVEVTSADFSSFSHYLGGGGVSWGEGSSAIVKGNTSVAVKGGGGIDILVGGGLSRAGGNAGVEGNTSIAIIGDAGLKALTKDAWIIAGGKLDEETGNAISTSSAAVSGDATITFANIEKGVFAGKITGQGVQRTVEKKPYDKNTNDTFDYTTSVAGASVLVFDNVKADFSGAKIKEMDRVEIANGTELTLSNLGAAKELKLTGDWAGKGTVTAVSVKTNGDNIEIDDDEANGIIDYKVTPDASGFKVVVNCSKTEKEKPVKPNLPEESPKDIITAIPGVIYIDVTSADAKKEAVEDVVAAVGGVLKAEDLVVNEETALIEAAESTVVKAAEKALADKGERATVAKVRPLPVFAVESGDITEAGAVVAVGFEMKGSEFLAAKPEEVRLLKVQGSAAGKFFEYTSDPKAFGDGSFTVQDENDAVFAGTFDADTKYKLVLFIKDNGEFDLRSAEREICDPAAIVQTESKASSGSSGGCSAGFAALALIALLPLAMRGKKR
ncbi:Synerg-CTERM sorting domain-containing protein [Cloacibacillus evryensis]|uniref:SYNERG-CTERM sorting domain-containing protein n=1 Tax=Cloacibacillus evryensis TaxID=508460 RepID=A0AAW5K842_9BACT|nr:Synerg-CTERM sorting domain-containing protein [Cloacibacillus evryensis]MCQ4814184.1 SYNERG-CTERM sorting domain-containing protein [Cloacibacillus evryensis]